LDVTSTGTAHVAYTFAFLNTSREFFQFRRSEITQTMPGYNIRTVDEYILTFPFDMDVF
jgi:hypothetical protein